jgi:hypothetical protein
MHHLGAFTEQGLNDVIHVGFSPAGYSPDRVDALVWGTTDLLIELMNGAAIFELYRRDAAALAGRHPGVADSRVDWRRRYDAIFEAPTPDHPDVRGGKVIHVNGPKMKPE